MLKLSHEKDERLGGALMEWWEGEGAALVFARDDTALLMERATGSASLADMTRSGMDDEAAVFYVPPQQGCMRRAPSSFPN